jgi:hypothetical protein
MPVEESGVTITALHDRCQAPYHGKGATNGKCPRYGWLYKLTAAFGNPRMFICRDHLENKRYQVLKPEIVREDEL